MCKYQHDQRNKEIRNWEPRHVCLKREVLQVKNYSANFYLQKRHNFAEMTVSKILHGVTCKKYKAICLLTNLIYRLIRSYYVCTKEVTTIPITVRSPNSNVCIQLKSKNVMHTQTDTKEALVWS